MTALGSKELPELDLKELQPLLREAFSDLLRPKPYLNKEQSLGLQSNKKFLRSLDRARMTLKLPTNLNPHTDIKTVLVSITDGETHIEESLYFNSLTKEKREKHNEQIVKILRAFNLPPHFQDYILHWLLYRKPSNAIPMFDWELLRRIIEEPGEVRWEKLSTTQKKFLQWQFKMLMGMKQHGRPLEQHAKVYRSFKYLLSGSKNRNRRSKTLEETTKALDLRSKKTLREVADELTPDISAEENMAELSNKNYTKIRQRAARFSTGKKFQKK